MEATREIVRVTGKPLRWTLIAVRIAGWMLWISSILLIAVACILAFVAVNLKGKWLILVAVMAACSGFGSFLSCYGYTQLLTFRALITRLNSALDRVERVVETSADSLEEIRRMRYGDKKGPKTAAAGPPPAGGQEKVESQV